MMTFRKLAADSDGKLIRAYFTEHSRSLSPAPSWSAAHGRMPGDG